MEIGYKASEEYFSYNEFGKLKFYKEEDANRILGKIKSKTKLSVMAVSTVSKEKLENMLKLASNSDVNIVSIVDIFGSLYVDDIKELASKYLRFLNSNRKQVGIHAHNNTQMAYANTIEDIKYGATYVDATMAGLGRGDGNCNLELILGFLKGEKYSMKPIIKCIEEYILPLKRKINWGQDIAYMLTSQHNMHQRSAIYFLKEENPEQNYVKFFEYISEIS